MQRLRKVGFGRARACVAAIAVVAALAAVSAPAAMAVPGKFWGVVPQAAPTAEQLQRLKRGGVDSIRIPVVWGAVQHSRDGAFVWSSVDGVVADAVTAGFEVLPFLTGAPPWAVAMDRHLHSPKTLPVKTGVQRASWKNFVRQAVLRYGPGGSFWLENPGLPMRPIRSWQIWNEPNFKYFVARPNPADYGALVKLSYAAIRSVDRGGKVILAGLFSNPAGARYSAKEFIDQMYRRTRGIRSKFQGVGLHPYTGNYKRLGPYIEEVRDVLKAHRDAGKGLWITELGWSSMRPTRSNSFAKGRGGQAAQLRGAFRLLVKNRVKWRLKRVYWFSIDDQAGTCNFCDGSGLFGEGFVPKPAWRAYVKFAGGSAG